MTLWGPLPVVESLVKYPSNSPCVGICKLENGECVGCQRTIHQISNWGNYSVDDRLKLMQEIQRRKFTHSCPQCDEFTYCAVEAGKSGNLCWCVFEERIDNVGLSSNVCLCKACLKGEE